jgi:tetratricopeptide (TPR) repeat protein
MRAPLWLAILAGCASNPGPPVNEQVMYGGVFKSSGMRLADEEFIETAKRDFSSARAASEHYAALGWQLLRRDDARTAIKRFNQCWLLDEGNPSCFWGFGAFEKQRGHADKAIEYLEKAQAMMPSPSVDFHVDLATAYALKGHLSSNDPVLAGRMLDRADAIFQQAAAAEPANQKVPCVWAMVLVQTNNPKKACQVVEGCKDDRDGVRKLLTCP